MRLDQIDLNLLKILHALFRTESVTLAARQLGVSQSAISKSLGRLRTILGDQLFIKHGNGGIAFTKRAEALREPLEDWYAATRKVLHAQKDFDPKDITGRFTIACTDFGVFSVIAPAMPHILRAAPGIQLRLVPMRQDSAAQLATGNVDIALSALSLDAARSHSRWLFDEPVVCLMNCNHPLAQARSARLGLNELLNWPHYSMILQENQVDIIDVALGELGLQRRVALQIPYFWVAPLVLSDTNALLILPARAAAHYANIGGFAVRDLPEQFTCIHYHILWTERARHDPATEWLIDQLATHCSAGQLAE